MTFSEAQNHGGLSDEGNGPPLTAGEAWVVCETVWRRSHGSGAFIAVLEGEERDMMATSPLFRWRKPGAAPPEHAEAVLALAALDEELAEAGWERIDAAGETWCARRFRRRATRLSERINSYLVEAASLSIPWPDPATLRPPLANGDPHGAALIAAGHEEGEPPAAARRDVEPRAALRHETERIEVERQVAERREQERQTAERRERERLEALRREVERLGVEQRQAERRERERFEVERLAIGRLEILRREVERLGVEQREAERREAERLEVERLAIERLEVLRREVERLGLEQREAELREVERLEAERLAIARLEVLRREVERLEVERREAELREAERLEALRRKAERLDDARRNAEVLRAERLEVRRRRTRGVSQPADEGADLDASTADSWFVPSGRKKPPKAEEPAGVLSDLVNRYSAKVDPPTEVRSGFGHRKLLRPADRIEDQRRRGH